MKKITLLFIGIFTVGSCLFAQKNDVNISEEIVKILLPAEKANFEKGTKKLSQANIMAVPSQGKHELAEKTRQQAQTKKRRKKKKLLKLAKKYDKAAVKMYQPASNLHYQGGKFVFSALGKTLDNLYKKSTKVQKNILDEFKKEYTNFYAESKNKRKKAQKEKDYSRKYQFLLEADQLLTQAYEHQSMALTEHYGWLKQKPEIKEEVADTTRKSNQTEDEFALYKKDSIPTKKKVSLNGISFKIQIAASTKPLNVSELRNIYAGDVVFNNEKSGNWYRYLINEYPTYEMAIIAKRKLNIKGSFVVAYRNGNRINNIKEVANPIGDYSTQFSTQKNIEYRLQIGTSALPASASEIRKMNSTNLDIKTYKSGTYYKYTIGSFATEQDAENFKRENKLTKYIVVKYQNGKEK